MEQTLQSVMLASLQRINTEINLSQQRQIFNKLELIDFLDVIEVHIQKFQTLNGLQPPQF